MAPESSDDAHRATVLSCVLVVAIVGSSFGATVGVVAGSASGGNAEFGVHIAQQNNTTVRHENPAAVDEEGNLSAVQTWLSGQLTQTLVDCTEGLKVGEYDVCSRSRNYPEWLNKYVNVTRETDGTNRTNSFVRARENQEEYASNVSRFRETLSAYRTARENGDTERARTLARRLQRIATRVNETGGQLTQEYHTIDNATNRDVSSAIDTTNTITRNVTETAETIEVEQFINTTLRVDAASRTISFRQPLRVSGRLVAENGTPLAGRTIRLDAGNRSRTTTTNADGRFTLTYRPTVLPLDTERVTVRYVPSVLSPYRNNETTIPIRVAQVEPTLDISQHPLRMGFNDTVLVTGRVGVNGTGAHSVPVSVAIDGHSLTPVDDQRVRTDSAGRFTFAARLPADVPPGKQVMRVSLPLQDRALASTAVTKQVTVVSTPTTLTVNGSQTSVNGSAIGGPVVRVAGRLTTDSGTPLREQSVTLRLNGTTVGTAQTDERGRYVTNVSVPRQLFAGRSDEVTVSLVAAYNSERTNLESSRARTQLQLVVPTESPSIVERVLRILGTVPIVVWLVGAGLLLAYSAYRYRNSGDSDRSGTATSGESTVGRRSDTENGRTGRPPLLEAASERLFAGDAEGAIVAAYTGVRARLGDEFDLTSPHTHWEFFDTCRLRGLSGDRLAALERLTELYERAAFSPHPPSEDVATTAIEDARTVNGPDQPPEAQHTADD